MERPVDDMPSRAWATSRDVPGVLRGATSAGAEARPGHPAGRRVRGALQAVLAELETAGRILTVEVAGPDAAEEEKGRAWLAERNVTAEDVARRFGGSVADGSVADEDLPGWVSAWTVTASGPVGSATLQVLPSRAPAELGVELAEWLQDVLADQNYSEPVPRCPDHTHPMLPVVRDEAAWWSCPRRGPVRPWLTQPTPEDE
jgi:hypothetical protein